MLLKYFYNEKLAHSSYLVGCPEKGVAIIIDPGRFIEQYIEFAKQEGLKIIAVAETHIHADFLSGAKEFSLLYNTRLYLSDEGDKNWKYEYLNEVNHQLLKDTDEFDIGNIKFQVIHTPGHTPESISFLVIDTTQGNQTNQKPIGIFTGDFVFVGDVGRPDLLEATTGVKGSTDLAARQLFHSLQRFKNLPDYLQIWPSHGAGSACGRALGAIPSSTVGYEKLFNWAFKYEDENSFVKALLTGQPEPPKYFSMMKKLNKIGAPLRKKTDPPEKTQQNSNDSIQIIDTRVAEDFASGHLVGSINIPYDKSFTNWVGWLINYYEDILLIIDTNQTSIEEIIRDLESIGLDQTIAYIPSKVIKQMENLETYHEKTVLELYEDIQTGRVPVIDVRSKREWNNGHLPNGTHIMLGYLMDSLDIIPERRPIVLQCRSGVRSAIAASILQKNGIKEVINLKGGYLAWQNEKLPCIKY